MNLSYTDSMATGRSLRMATLIIAGAVVLLCGATLGATVGNERQGAIWMRRYTKEAERLLHDSSEAQWNYYVDMTPENRRISEMKSELYANFSKAARQEAAQFNWRHFKNSLLRRSFSIVSSPGMAILPQKDFAEYMKLKGEMQDIYSKGKLCASGVRPLHLDPEITEIMATSRNRHNLLWAWKGWHDEVGPPMRQKYRRFVELLNEAARLENKTDESVIWKGAFYHAGKPKYNFEDDINRIFIQLKPLYAKLHSFVRAKLKAFYGQRHFPSSGHIPAHLLGNMWAQSWVNIEPLLLPGGASTSADATPALQNLTVLDMFRASESFFTSMGLPPMPGTFWTKSMLTRPQGKDVVCHGSAFDLHDGKDFRIKMCTVKTMEDFTTIHHEMGHVEYYMQYSKVPLLFRRSANSGFHEAIGDLIALSVSNPRHMERVGLLKNATSNNETDLAFLLRTALNKVAIIPFSKLMDDWRWSVFNGSINSDDYTKSWWKFRCQYQGVSPPVSRSENDFDPGAKYHIASNTPYVRYFVAVILQFQFHRELCKAAGHTGPLHTCDLYGSKVAGDKLRKMMRIGALKPWHKALKIATGSESMDPSAITDYFKPLIEWLDAQRVSDSLPDGWSDQCPDPPSTSVPPASCPPSVGRAKRNEPEMFSQHSFEEESLAELFQDDYLYEDA